MGTFNPDTVIFDSGTKMWFYQNVAPTGWTIDNTPADALLAVKGGANAYNVAGGNQAGTWTQPNHTHTGSSHAHAGPNHSHTGPEHYHSVDPPDTTTGTPNVGTGVQSGSGTTVSAHTHTHQVNIASFNSGLHGTGYTGTSGTGATSAAGTGATGGGAAAATYRPLAQVGIICTKD